MNMQSLMAQAQKMKKDIDAITKEIDAKVFMGSNGVVSVEMTGKYEVKNISIAEEGVDKEILEDMILLSVNDVLSKISKEKEERLGKYTGGMGGLF